MKGKNIMNYELNLEAVFREDVIIDVTNFDAKNADDSLGYMCGGAISIFSDGLILINTVSEELEKLHISEICYINFDPEHIMEISIVTHSKKIRIMFKDTEMKSKCWETFSRLYKFKQKLISGLSTILI